MPHIAQKWASMGPPLIVETAWHRVGTEAAKSLDVLCRQSRRLKLSGVKLLRTEPHGFL